MKLPITIAISALAAVGFAAPPTLTQSFLGLVDGSGTSDITPILTAGWVVDNESTPVGVTNWFGSNFNDNGEITNPDLSLSDSFIAANFNATGATGTIADYLISPEVELGTGGVLTFQTISDEGAPDALNVLVSTSGGSVAPASFTSTVLQINPGLTLLGYPAVWTTYTITLAGIPNSSTGRFAFEYSVPNGGQLGANSSFIGIANVAYAVPEPAPFAALGLGALFLIRRRRK